MTARTSSASDVLRERANKLTPAGVHSNVRMTGPLVFFERAKGGWLWDADGNDYVDYLLGQGPNFLGHAHEQVNARVAEATSKGLIYGAQHPLEVEAGELFLDTLGWADMVRFSMTGTEADQAALRLARAATGRTKFVRFEGHYHGWLDNVLLAYDDEFHPIAASPGQMESHLDDFYTLPWNDLGALEQLLADKSDDIAAIITEPFMCNTGAVSPQPGYLEGMRTLCDKYGIVLIFDEVITGFRFALGGASERFGVTPDLATYGKAMAGGWPVAALAGKAELMQMFAEGVNHSGTFNASVMACAAVAETLKVLRDDPPYERVEAHGTALMAGLRELATKHDLPLRVQGVGMAFHASFGHNEVVHNFRDLQSLDLDRYNTLSRKLMDNGVWVAGRGIWYVSAAHGDKELNAALERVDATLTAGGF
ncbi:MAG: aspartate aminotransferase family protein [Nitriliruptoraceae bacterium]